MAQPSINLQTSSPPHLKPQTSIKPKDSNLSTTKEFLIPFSNPILQSKVELKVPSIANHFHMSIWEKYLHRQVIYNGLIQKIAGDYHLT